MSRREVASAYTAAAPDWAAGPDRIYGRLAREVVTRSPVSLAGARVLDVGAGTGATSAALTAVGAHAVAVDTASGMLAFRREVRPPCARADAAMLPFGARSFDGVVASFVLNHLDDPATALADAVRVTRRSGVVLASAYADDDTHPVKAAVDAAMSERGWIPEPWYRHVQAVTAPAVATVDRCETVLVRCGQRGAVERIRVPFPDVTPRDLVSWRVGMAQFASFLADIDDAEREALFDDALALLGEDVPVLERSILVISVVV